MQPSLALLALIFGVSDAVMEALLLTSLSVPLVMIREAGALGAMGEGQRHALGYMAVRLFFNGWSFALLLFSGFCALLGLLIVWSRFVPRVIGVLMIAAGAGYFVNSLAGLLQPELSNALIPWILLPSFVGELSLGLWLTAKGIKTPS